MRRAVYSEIALFRLALCDSSFIREFVLDPFLTINVPLAPSPAPPLTTCT